ncbi:SIMPL domain-containing protein [Glycocaulis alkaliphilus]|nr:SIMPL domain-containing protein [Glycocaulis alkaliphilus]GGB70733.1 SIMPL domain-containing protein [Glycocaulis alkaliphilus]
MNHSLNVTPARMALRRRLTGAALAAGLLLGAAAMMPVPAFAQAQSETQEGRLSLSAQGEVRIAPDMATVSAGARTRADTAAEALAANARAMSGVFQALERAGIARRDIQTSGLSLNAVYEPYDSERGRDQRIAGYEASNTVRVIVRDMDRVGRTIDALVSSGANQLQGVNFTHSDPAEARDEARRRAVNELNRLRSLYAEAAGISTGRLISLSESSSSQPSPMMYARAESVSMDAGTEVAPGEITISVNVDAVWAIQP